MHVSDGFDLLDARHLVPLVPPRYPSVDHGCVTMLVTVLMFPLTSDLTWTQRHGSGPVHDQRHGAALLLPARLPHRPRLCQGNGRGEEDGARGAGGLKGGARARPNGCVCVLRTCWCWLKRAVSTPESSALPAW